MLIDYPEPFSKPVITSFYSYLQLLKSSVYISRIQKHFLADSFGGRNILLKYIHEASLGQEMRGKWGVKIADSIIYMAI